MQRERERERIFTSLHIFGMSEFSQINIYSSRNLKLLVNQMTNAMVKDFVCKIQAEEKFSRYLQI